MPKVSMMADAPTKLTIGLVLDTSLDPPDGVQQYVISLGEWLRAAGHEVHYLVGETSRHDLPNIHSLSRNIRVRFNGNRTTIPLPTSRRRLRRFLADHHFDILHVQSPHHPLMAQRLLLAAPVTTAVVATFHILPYSPLVRHANRLLGWWLRPSLRRIDQMLAVSPMAAEFERETFGLDARVLPNVFDYPRFHDAEPFEQYADDVRTILFLGRLVPRKGCRYLLEAVASLDRSALPPFRVVVCGKGPLRGELETFAHEAGIADVVEFTGFVSETDKPRYYASADIAVFPSTGGESFGIVLLEAMAGGKAVVLAGDNPGYASVMQPRPETLFSPADIPDLAARLELYLTDETACRELAAWGEAYSQRFAIDRVGPELVSLYKQLLASKNLP